MKKFASRVLALVIALSMLLASTAFAAERNAATFSIGNFEITVDEETISLPVTLSIGGGVDIEGIRGYLTADVSTETASALSALAAFENGEIKAHLNGMNYGLTIPLEQLITMLESELGMTLEEAMGEVMGEVMGELESAFTEETMAAMTGMLESAAALEGIEIDPEALMTALGITLADGGEYTVTLFDVEADATAVALTMKPQTLKEAFDEIAALDPALKQYMDEYFAILNESMAASGEEVEIEEVLALITIGLDGMIYEAENGTLIEMNASLTVEDETVSVPLFITTLTDEIGSYGDLTVIIEADGEMVGITFYADNYFAEGADCANFIISASIGDVDAEEADSEFSLSFNRTATAESTGVYLDLVVSDYGDVATAGIGYIGYPVVSTEETDSYDGLLNVYFADEYSNIDAYAVTNLTLSSVPEGELLPLSQSINPLEADDETINKLASDAETALIQGLGVLMQDPTLAALFGGAME